MFQDLLWSFLQQPELEAISEDIISKDPGLKSYLGFNFFNQLQTCFECDLQVLVSEWIEF